MTLNHASESPRVQPRRVRSATTSTRRPNRTAAASTNQKGLRVRTCDRLRGDAGRALASGGARRPLYFCDDGLDVGRAAVAVFPHGRRVAAASRDNTLKVWDAATGKCVATLGGTECRGRCGAPLHYCSWYFCGLCVFVASWRCGVSGRAARRFCIAGQDARASLGRGERQMRRRWKGTAF